MTLLEALFSGLSSSAIYAVMALGFVVIFKGTKVMNLAQGSLMLLGVFIIFLLAPSLGFWAASAVGIAIGVLGGIAMQYIVGAAKTEDHLVMVIMTVAIDLILTSVLITMIGDNRLYTLDPWQDELLTIADANLPVVRIAAFVVAVILIAVFFLTFRLTPFGIKMRAAAADAETSALMGISQRRVQLWSWGIGGGLAVVGGIFIGAFPNSGLTGHSAPMMMAVIPAIIIGGMDSFEGAIVGSLIVGFTESFSRVAISLWIPWLNDGFAAVVPYILMLVILLIKPSGLFGTKVINRV